MDTKTGHLVASVGHCNQEDRRNYTPVPDYLLEEAKRELAGKSEAYIKSLDLSVEEQKLVNWAKYDLRRKARKANKRKANKFNCA